MEFKKIIKRFCFNLLLSKSSDVSFFCFKRSDSFPNSYLLSQDSLGFIYIDRKIYQINAGGSLESIMAKNVNKFELIKTINENNISWETINKFLIRKKISQEQFLSLMELEQIPKEVQAEIDQFNINKNLNKETKTTIPNKI